jgi:hypothetical protein
MPSRVKSVIFILSFLVIGALCFSAQSKTKPKVTVLPMPINSVSIQDQDLILGIIAKELRTQYSVRVVSGRSVGRSVWGTFGSGLEDAASSLASLVSQGKESYEMLQVGKALELFEQAKQIEMFGGADVLDTDLLVEMHVFYGLTLLVQGHEAKAAEEFRQAVSHDPTFELSSRKYAPNVVRAFTKAKKQLLSGKPTKVTIHSEPEGATVYLDGLELGTTPLKNYPVFPGHHFFRLESSNYTAWTHYVRDRGVPPKKINAQLVPKWQEDAPTEIIAAAITVDKPDEEAFSQLEELAEFFKTDALLLANISKNKTNNNFELGVRLYLTASREVSKAKTYTLGSKRKRIPRKIAGVIHTLKALKKLKSKELIAKPKDRTETLPDKVVVAFKDPGKKELVKKKEKEPVLPDPSTSVGPAGSAWYKKWWLWTIVGVVVAGGVAGVAIWQTQPEDSWTLYVE